MSTTSSNISSMSLPQLQQQYNLITQAIMQYQNEERALWNQIVTTEDPSFSNNMDSYNRQKMVLQLQNDREQIMGYITDQYNKNTAQQASALKYKNNSNLIATIQDDLYKQNNHTLGSVNSDLVTFDRLSSMMKEEYAKILFRSQLVNLTLIYASVIIVVLVVGVSYKRLAVYSIILAAIIGVVFLVNFVMRLWSLRRNYRMLSVEQDFGGFPPENSGMNPSVVCSVVDNSTITASS
jgi:energy-converting hydrogenase Eha subunit C